MFYQISALEITTFPVVDVPIFFQNCLHDSPSYFRWSILSRKYCLNQVSFTTVLIPQRVSHCDWYLKPHHWWLQEISPKCLLLNLMVRPLAIQFLLGLNSLPWHVRKHWTVLLGWFSRDVTRVVCYCLGCTVALLNARESPRATKTPSRGSCAGSTHTRSGLARRFGNSTFPTIRFPLAAILTVSFVSTIQNSDYLRPISCVCCLHSFSRVPSPLLTLERSFDRDGRF